MGQGHPRFAGASPLFRRPLMGTRRMLISLVRRDRPDWTDKECVRWLARHIDELKKYLRAQTGDWIRQELMLHNIDE